MHSLLKIILRGALEDGAEDKAAPPQIEIPARSVEFSPWADRLQFVTADGEHRDIPYDAETQLFMFDGQAYEFATVYAA